MQQNWSENTLFFQKTVTGDLVQIYATLWALSFCAKGKKSSRIRGFDRTSSTYIIPASFQYRKLSLHSPLNSKSVACTVTTFSILFCIWSHSFISRGSIFLFKDHQNFAYFTRFSERLRIWGASKDLLGNKGCWTEGHNKDLDKVYQEMISHYTIPRVFAEPGCTVGQQTL